MKNHENIAESPYESDSQLRSAQRSLDEQRAVQASKQRLKRAFTDMSSTGKTDDGSAVGENNMNGKPAEIQTSLKHHRDAKNTKPKRLV